MDIRSRIFQVTNSLWIGPFASPERKSALVAAKISHILNVGEAPNALSADDGDFREIAWHPIEDLVRVPESLAITCLETLHRMISSADANVYVHCIAGQNRSPSVVWLYLVACGVPGHTAKSLIERGAPDAIPAHPKLVDTDLIEFVTQFGRQRFLPHARPIVLTAAG